MGKEIWYNQMNAEQHRVADLQALPDGPGLFCRLAALSDVYVTVLHCAPVALPGNKIETGIAFSDCVNKPGGLHE